jgi:dienelactone hydrolase
MTAALMTGGASTAGPDTGGRAHGGSHAARVVVEDVTIRVPRQDPVQAYVVRPAGHLKQSSTAGVLFLHWLGEINNDRGEYLTEAITLAEQGVVSVLPQGYFPWVPNPDGTTNDVRLVKNQVKAFRAALNRLASVDAVDESRIAVVGHDYGAMYGALLADSDERVSVMVLQAPDARMGNWFATF